jgi:hypothetical protein
MYSNSLLEILYTHHICVQVSVWGGICNYVFVCMVLVHHDKADAFELVCVCVCVLVFMLAVS